MVKANFEEKTYECAYNIELATGVGGNPRVFSPGQVLENLIGFDSASDPGSSHVVWQVLGVRRPPGLSLLPEHWPLSPSGTPKSEQLPRKPVSLMLQFKRPEYLMGTRAKQWKLWLGPYYRFERERKQHAILRRLDRDLAGAATIRYAAPAFHTVADLEAAQLAGKVIARSGHVAPNALGRHQVWTYQKAGVNGRANPDGQELPFSTLDQLFVRLPTEDRLSGAAVVQYDGLDDHLETVAVACRARNPTLGRVMNTWERTLSRENVRLDRRRSVVNYATIQTLCSWQRLSWWLLDGLEVRPIPSVPED